MAVEIVTPPAEEPITLAEAKAHCRIDIDDDDALLGSLILDAREWCERYTRRALVTQTWRLHLDAFPPSVGIHGGPLQLPGGKVQSVTSVDYLDGDGDAQTLDAADYQLSSKDPQRPAFIVPAYGTSWPSTREVPDAVSVTYVAGYGAAAAVPQIFKSAMLLHVGYYYANREPMTFGTTGATPQILGALETKLADARLFQFG